MSVLTTDKMHTTRMHRFPMISHGPLIVSKKPERPELPEIPEMPERPEMPDRPDRPDRP